MLVKIDIVFKVKVFKLDEIGLYSLFWLRSMYLWVIFCKLILLRFSEVKLFVLWNIEFMLFKFDDVC